MNPGSAAVLGGDPHVQMPCALSYRELFCSGCPGRDCISSQCFIPLVTSHLLGGNSFVFFFKSNLSQLLDREMDVDCVQREVKEDASVIIRIWRIKR